MANIANSVWKNLGSAFSWIKSGAKSAYNFVSEKITGTLNNVKGIIHTVADTTKQAALSVWNNLAKAFSWIKLKVQSSPLIVGFYLDNAPKINSVIFVGFCLYKKSGGKADRAGIAKKIAMLVIDLIHLGQKAKIIESWAGVVGQAAMLGFNLIDLGQKVKRV